MARINVDKMPLKQLLDLEARLTGAIAAARERERAEAKQELAVFAEKRGFALRELFGGRGKGKAAVPRYVNPDNPAETWAGRGRKPNWLVAKLKKGAKIESFGI